MASEFAKIDRALDEVLGIPPARAALREAMEGEDIGV